MLTINTIHKAYDGTEVLRGISLEVPAGATMALLGPSGCGKTTLLRVVAGLERADGGAILFGGERIDGVPPHLRGFGMMFQDYALFPHMDVAANVAFGLRMRGLGRAQVAARAAEALALVGMAGYGRRRVFELSGGERQRVALARALAPGPRLLMLDEPLAALDRELRERLQEELRAVLRQVGVTAIYVTHDQEEAFALADVVALLNAGRLEQAGPPEAIYRRPASLWAARFLGLRNLAPGRHLGDGRVATGLGELAGTLIGELAPGADAVAVIAPDAAAPAGASRLRGELESLQFRGRHYRVGLRAAGGQLIDLDMAAPPGAVGDLVGLGLTPARVLIYPA
ncbi:ABC transporter ATP-binding protein [Oscillochloris sp. ZM17-4]|uniref:ABC transporter ATP-binding protein n=1 Tax=Oscillochloris sp. ZM17-4 TaxID=2866714 RepID=UPI001C72D083|nr:ABC transporter ATP-binding protein [Oscillochloris sp. ZM17-4]MBX0326268.1 ABC transporter ATP-binding protein [Oscillochloris sp. ZM17-4]